MDISSKDLDGTRAFYGGLFGSSSSPCPDPKACGYTMFQLEGTDVAAAAAMQGGGAPS